jgi:hypothetical protein
MIMEILLPLDDIRPCPNGQKVERVVSYAMIVTGLVLIALRLDAEITIISATALKYLRLPNSILVPRFNRFQGPGAL